MKKTSIPLALREWRYPRTYRTIFAKEPGSIFQADVMHLEPLWKHIFNEQEIQKYHLKKYALVCIDVFSRYVWAVAMDRQDAPSTFRAFLEIFRYMGKPKILQGDQKIILKYIQKEFSKYFPEITLVASKPAETNKNAIVERAIRTIKNDLLKYLYTHKFPEYQFDVDNTSIILQAVCYLRNNTFHRTIQEKPIDVFYSRAPNRQIIVRKTYPQFKVGQYVLVKPLRERGDIGIKPFRFDYDIYVIAIKDGDKYKVKSLYNHIHHIDELKKQWYKPYELRPMTYKDFYEHLHSPLVQQYLTHVYGTPNVIDEYLKTLFKPFL
jgi:hypothetical protein